MEKRVTTLSFMSQGEGVRMSICFSNVNDKGIVTVANQRENRILLDSEMLQKYKDLKEYAQKLINE